MSLATVSQLVEAPAGWRAHSAYAVDLGAGAVLIHWEPRPAANDDPGDADPPVVVPPTTAQQPPDGDGWRLLRELPPWTASRTEPERVFEVYTVGVTQICVSTAVVPLADIIGQRFEVLVLGAGELGEQIFHRTKGNVWCRGGFVLDETNQRTWDAAPLAPQPEASASGAVLLELYVHSKHDQTTVRLGENRERGITRPAWGYRYGVTTVWGR